MKKETRTTILLVIVFLGLSYGVTLFQSWFQNWKKEDAKKQEVQAIYKSIQIDKAEVEKLKKSIKEIDRNSSIAYMKIVIEYYNREIEAYYLELKMLEK
jgi:Tfp pilus assembly protein PilO